MKLLDAQLHTDHVIERLPAFTLRTALAWIGHHHCHCPEQTHARANTWLISPPSEGRPTGMRALVDVEFTDPSWSRAQGIDVTGAINECTCQDRIQVEQRNDAERSAIAATGAWLSTVADR